MEIVQKIITQNENELILYIRDKSTEKDFSFLSYIYYYDLSSGNLIETIDLGYQHRRSMLSNTGEYYMSFGLDYERKESWIDISRPSESTSFRNFEFLGPSYVYGARNQNDRIAFSENDTYLYYAAYCTPKKSHYVGHNDSIVMHNLKTDNTIVHKVPAGSSDKVAVDVDIENFTMSPDETLLIYSSHNSNFSRREINFYNFIEDNGIYSYDEMLNRNGRVYFKGNYVASHSYNSGYSSIYDITNFNILFNLKASDGVIKDIVYTSDASMITATYGDKIIRTFMTSNGQQLTTITRSNIADSIFLASDDKTLFAESRMGIYVSPEGDVTFNNIPKYDIEIYDITTGNRIKGLTDERLRRIDQLSKSSRYLITKGCDLNNFEKDNRIYIWDLSEQ